MGKVLELPPEIWDGLDYTSIHAVAIFADIQNSVLISSMLSLREYDNLVCEFQDAMLQLVGQLREQQMPIGDYHVVGDQLSLFLYDPTEVERNYLLDGPARFTGVEREQVILASTNSKRDLLYHALKASIQLKNHWLVQRFNMGRVTSHQAPFELSIGMHFGRVFLRNRPDGKLRIEGYAVNLAKRIEGASRLGRYSYIMLSRETCESLRRAVIGHSQLRQRVFFHRHELDMFELKGVAKPQAVFELKFYHRLNIPFPDEAIPLYEALFAVDPGNAWAYYQLAEHYSYKLGDWEAVYRLACKAYVAHPQDEKIKLDLARYHARAGDFKMSELYCREALQHNPEFDLAYELLATLADEAGDPQRMIDCMRSSVSLSPGSPGNHMNLGIALHNAQQYRDALRHFVTALRGFPEYIEQPRVQQALLETSGQAELPDDVAGLLQRFTGQP